MDRKRSTNKQWYGQGIANNAGEAGLGGWIRAAAPSLAEPNCTAGDSRQAHATGLNLPPVMDMNLFPGSSATLAANTVSHTSNNSNNFFTPLVSQLAMELQLHQQIEAMAQQHLLESSWQQPTLGPPDSTFRTYHQELVESASHQIQQANQLEQQQQQPTAETPAFPLSPGALSSLLRYPSGPTAATTSTPSNQYSLLAGTTTLTTPPAASMPILIQEPTKHDVLFGRGQPLRDHPGNIRMRRLLKEYRNRYFQTIDRDAKTAITRQLMQRLRRKGTRFLRRAPSHSAWTIVPDAEARRKLSHAMRDSVRSLTKKKIDEEDNDNNNNDNRNKKPPALEDVNATTLDLCAG